MSRKKVSKYGEYSIAELEEVERELERVIPILEARLQKMRIQKANLSRILNKDARRIYATIERSVPHKDTDAAESIKARGW